MPARRFAILIAAVLAAAALTVALASFVLPASGGAVPALSLAALLGRALLGQSR